jgi:hypothetical protein
MAYKKICTATVGALCSYGKICFSQYRFYEIKNIKLKLSIVFGM